MKTFFNFVRRSNPLNLIIPPHCLTCQSESAQPVCSSCLTALEIPRPGCRICANPHAATALFQCEWCERLRVKPDWIWTPIAYRNTGRDVYQRIKFQGYWRLIPLLLSEALRRAPLEPKFWDFECLTSVPEVFLSKVHRAFNPSDQIAKNLSFQTGVEHKWLLKTRLFGRHQVGLGFKERRSNMKNRFRCTKDIPKSVIIVDDVLTTGATLEAATLALRRAGAQRVGWLTLLRTI